ncbi:MAG: hypothetical protein JKY19_02385 [Alcanivoracaceae bacterium]|nr:hypothetical protein [Alcanivoracaceae bacterium]
MKSIIYLMVFSILLFIVFYYSADHSDLTKKVAPINHASFQLTESSAVDKGKTAIPSVKKSSIINDVDDDINTESENYDLKELELDYIAAYRDWQYFANCYTDVEDYHNQKDPLQTLVDRFENSSRESQTEPTAQQNMYYQHHVDICKAMIDDEDDSYNQIVQKLRQKFNKIIPKTDEEKQLAHALQMVAQLNNFEREYSTMQLSKSALTNDELNAINIQMQRLTNDMMNLYDGNEVLSSEQTQLIKQYSEQIENLRLRIENSKVTDNELMTEIEAKIDGYINSMDDYLHRVQSADAFLVIGEVIYKSRPNQKDSSVLKKLKEKTMVYDSLYIAMLNAIVMPLVACSMNYPCDAESDLILSYCLGLKDSMFNQACGLSLEDFYFNFYIGSNQLNDVNNYFSYMVNRYAN